MAGGFPIHGGSPISGMLYNKKSDQNGSFLVDEFSSGYHGKSIIKLHPNKGLA